MILLTLGIFILAIGPSLSTAGLYMPFTETSDTVVNFHFPNGNLTTREGEHYNVGGVYSTYYSWGDVIRVFNFVPHTINEYEEPIDLYVVFVTARAREFIERNTSLQKVSLIDLWRSPEHFFISPYDGEINVYLASPLSLNELEEKGYCGDWDVTFGLHHFAHGNVAILVFGIVMTFAGIFLITMSLRVRTEMERARIRAWRNYLLLSLLFQFSQNI